MVRPGPVESMVKLDEFTVLEFPARSVKLTRKAALLTFTTGTVQDFEKAVVKSGPAVEAVVPTVDQLMPSKDSTVKFNDVEV
jgi:hypothetical protein